MSKLLQKWANFGYQKQEIRTAIVFGINGQNIIFALVNDDVLAYGKNQEGCLGTGVEDEVKELKRIENLCQRRIEGCLEQKKVVQVACGYHHTLALTSEGEVYAFGRNDIGQLGLGTTDTHFLPQRVGGLLDGKIVTSVACQNYASLAILHSGEICAWGYNKNGRLGSPSTNNECSPCMVIGLEGVVISKIACGTDFILALSDDGKIYSWGENNKGQLGNGTTQLVKKSTIISTEMGRVKDIAATHYESHPCAAITEKNQVYFWGNCNGQFVLKPMLTSFSSLDEVFAVASPPVTYQRFRMKLTEDESESKRKGSVNERLRKAFDNPEISDFAFIVEGKKIHVHKNLLIFGSEVFKNLFLGDWKDSCQKEKIVEDHSYDAFYAFLKYFYTDEVDFSPELALDVYTIAHFYLVTDLMDECEKILQSGMTVQNVAAVYEKANLFGSKDLCEFCFKFCKKNWVNVMDNFESEDCQREFFMVVFRWVANREEN